MFGWFRFWCIYQKSSHGKLFLRIFHRIKRNKNAQQINWNICPFIRMIFSAADDFDICVCACAMRYSSLASGVVHWGAHRIKSPINQCVFGFFFFGGSRQIFVEELIFSFVCRCLAVLFCFRLFRFSYYGRLMRSIQGLWLLYLLLKQWNGM